MTLNLQAPTLIEAIQVYKYATWNAKAIYDLDLDRYRYFVFLREEVMYQIALLLGVIAEPNADHILTNAQWNSCINYMNDEKSNPSSNKG